MLSLLKRKEPPASPHAVDEAASVQAARTRARRRLIGAAVLVALGIIGFPLLFETQPRPIAVDIPIEISREGAAALGQPAPKSAAATPARPTGPAVAERAAEGPVEPTTRAAPASAAAQAASAAAPAAAAVPRVAAASAPVRAVAAAAAPASRAAAPQPEASRDAQRAQALLEGRPVASAAEPAAAAASDTKAARFVVQAGAYTDAVALREARQKVERLGMKTYTQVVETQNGARTRVRVGPFATRDEAEAAATRIKGSGLAVSILSL
ncbi:MAG TPA: SPOR domain-containing protein [Rubrivivax sp.]|nr:SPOR domain-containing protein [Rubrivivax sp.]